MTDNFNIIKEFIQSQWGDSFDKLDDLFYTIEIIHRTKDGDTIAAIPRGGGNRLHCIKVYYINKISDLDKYKLEIIKLCEDFNARAYFSINVKSYEHITKACMIEFANRISIDNYHKPQSIFESCTAKYVNKSNQLWILDVDKEDADHMNMSIDGLAEFYKNIVKECRPNKPVVTIIPTKSGKHIICHPFDTLKFFDGYPIGSNADALIKKNNNTLLYENIK